MLWLNKALLATCDLRRENMYATYTAYKPDTMLFIGIN